MKFKPIAYGATALAVFAMSCATVTPSYADDMPQTAPSDDAIVAEQQETNQGPDANVCSEFVEHPQLLASDTQPDGTPIQPQAAENATPVVLVHGWVSYFKHDDDHDGYFSKYVDRTANDRGGVLLADADVASSMIGIAQQVPGAQVYAFDYSEVGAHWVTDPYIGPNLAKGVECLAEAYGNKVVLVGHSMGGLTIREALSHETSDGTPVSDLVSHVLTIGTPHTGSIYAEIAATTVGGAASSDIAALRLPAKLVWDALGICNSLYEADVDCTPIPALNAFRGEGGQALRTGSKEIRELPPMPASVNYTAVSGDIQLGGISLFGKTSDPVVSLGDMLVDQKSATFAADSQVDNVCRYGVISK
ncbi:MAG: alpha/beta fold hydrolase [Actinomycetaceae bacterium]|nr:alpha/beta fold hydrolase [Actinomycetaceae bacterium]